MNKLDQETDSQHFRLNIRWTFSHQTRIFEFQADIENTAVLNWQNPSWIKLFRKQRNR